MPTSPSSVGRRRLAALACVAAAGAGAGVPPASASRMTTGPAAAAPATSPKPLTATRRAKCGGRVYEYLLFSPDRAAELPAVLLLHGAGGTPNDLFDPWLPFARREGAVLVAPRIPRERAFEPVAPAVFRCIVEDAKGAVGVNPRRTYLFGYSMGGYLAYDAAMLAADYFAAAATYAAAIAPEYDAIVDSAARRIPIALYAGELDPAYSPATVARTRDLLLRKGFPVRYMVMNGQDHAYWPVAERVNDDAWRFLSGYELPER